MSESSHGWLLRLLKVPPAPQLPSGDVRVFRSAPGHRTYRQLLWALRQLGLLAGLLAGSLGLIAFVPRLKYPWADEVAWVVEAFAWLGFVVQLPLGFLVARLDYSFRWYILSEGSLRIREGLVSYQEKTMTFANIQQVSIQQNPLQRLFGISDVKVETAGGGGSSHAKKGADSHHGEHLHEAHFRGVNNPEEIRDVIMARVRMHRDAGLGESQAEETVEPATTPTASLEAAQELLHEMRALRHALPRPRRPE